MDLFSCSPLSSHTSCLSGGNPQYIDYSNGGAATASNTIITAVPLGNFPVTAFTELYLMLTSSLKSWGSCSLLLL